MSFLYCNSILYVVKVKTLPLGFGFGVCGGTKPTKGDGAFGPGFLGLMNEFLSSSLIS